MAGSRRPPGAALRDPARVHWFSLIGVLGIIIAFGHSVLAMSGEETLAQVYREVETSEAPQLQEGGVHRLPLQPVPDLADQLLRSHDHPR